MTDEENYPESERLRKVSEKSQIIGEFIDWLHNEKDIHFHRIHEHTDGCYTPHDHTHWSECRRMQPMSGELHHFGMESTFEHRTEKCVVGSDHLDLVCGYPRDPTSSPHGLELVNYFPIEKLLAAFFDIDLDKVEQERRAMLKSLAEQSGG